MIYLDNAATTLVKPQNVAMGACKAVKNLASPGRGGHKYAMAAARVSFDCREKIAKLFNVDDPENIVFTMNGTHGLNIAIKSIISSGKTAVVSGYEHNSVVRPLYASGAVVEVAESDLFDREGTIKAFEEKINRNTSLVVCNHMSNVFGFILPVKEIGEICRENNVPFVVDASQSAGALKIDFKELNADFIAMPGHKGLFGPQGTGVLICRNGAKEILQGGTGSNSLSMDMPDFLPDKLEAGTHNMPGIAGLREGVKFVSAKGTENILRHEKRLIRYAASEMRKIAGTEVYFAENSDLQGGVLSFNISGMDSETVGKLLSDRGIAVRAGFHCSPLAHRSAGTLDIGTVRISVSPFNTLLDINALLNAVKSILRNKT